MAENSQKFFTTGEVSAALKISPTQIRGWEKRTILIKPHKRKGGRRYYSAKDVEILEKINSMINQKGLTLKQAIEFVENIHNPNKDSASLFDINSIDKQNYDGLGINKQALKSIYNKLKEIKTEIEKYD